MGYERVCPAADLSPGDMAAFYLEGEEVLLVRDESGDLHALDGICPHEDYPLVEGIFDGTVLTCVNHAWCFDVTTGKGIYPPSSRLRRVPLQVEGEDVYVDPDETVAP